MSLPLLQQTSDGTLLSLKLQPRSSKNQIGPVVGNQLKIHVTAPPVDGEANEALVRFLAEQLGCARGAVQFVKGQTSRNKVLLFKGLSSNEVSKLLSLTHL